jgi:hypothetical protein
MVGMPLLVTPLLLPESALLTSKSLCLLMLLTAVGACAGGKSSLGAAGDTRSTVRRDPNVIAMDELRDPTLSGQSVLEAVRKLRPNFLSSRGVQSRANPESGQVHASINGISVVPLEELRTMQLEGVVEIRFLNAAAAMQRFGGAAQEGPVILVVTM